MGRNKLTPVNRPFKDNSGLEIIPGDFLVYAVNRGSSPQMNYAIALEVVEVISHWGKNNDKLRVLTYDNFLYDKKKRTGIPGIRRAVLTRAGAIVRVSFSSIPYEIREKLISGIHDVKQDV